MIVTIKNAGMYNCIYVSIHGEMLWKQGIQNGVFWGKMVVWIDIYSNQGMVFW